MKGCTLILLSSLLLIPVGLAADAEGEFLSQLAVSKHLRSLHGDQPEAKIDAILYLSASRKPRFLRPLGTELLANLDKDSGTLFAAPQDPYIKSLLARGLGRMGRPEGLYYLSIALQRTEEIIADQKKRSMARWESDKRFAESENGKGEKTNNPESKEQSINARAIPRLTLEADRPGPALMRTGHSIPFSPDVHWSVSDEFKDAVVDVSDDTHRMRLRGYNYTNVAVAILIAYAEIFEEVGEKGRGDHGPAHVDLIRKFLKHEYAAVRSAAARALGQLGGRTALSSMDEQLKAEKDNVVRVILCRGVLEADRTRTDCYGQLLEALKHPDRDPRLAAAIALRELAFGESLPLLRDALALEETADIRRILSEAIQRATVDSLESPSEL